MHYLSVSFYESTATTSTTLDMMIFYKDEDVLSHYVVLLASGNSDRDISRATIITVIIITQY